ncbi:Potassium transporter [Psidium guajava]|nr:Potassium transporter [Psidium guajava]
MVIENKKKASLFVLVLLLFWAVFISQERCAEATRFSHGGCGSSCYAQEAAENGRHKGDKNLNLEGGDSDGDGGYADYDFYRKHGDVPSPGMGH